MDADTKRSVLEHVLDLNLDWIHAADSKTAPFLAIALAMLGALATLFKATHSWDMLVVVLSTCAGVLLAASIAFLAISAFPRMQAPRGSLIYFGQVAQLKLDEYVRALEAVELVSYLADVSSQCHINAVIAAKKHRFLSYAGMSLFSSVPFWLAALYVLFVSST